MHPWETLRISRAHYFRLKACKAHASLIEDYYLFRTTGMGERPWSQTHIRHTRSKLQGYLDIYPIVNYWGLQAHLNGTYSQNKDRHTALSGFCRYLVIKGLMDEQELTRIKKLYPRRSPYDKPRQRILNQDQASLIARVDDNLSFLLETGLRIFEFAALAPGDLKYSENPKESYVIVRCGKGGKSRKVPFSRKAQASSLLLGKSKDYWQKFIKGTADRLGIDFSAHSLRHYRITQWANNPRIPIAVVQRWAGHSDIKTTMGYVHIDDEMAMRAAYE